ncbi:hypothetical protein GCM10027360_04150 [Amycolatopsis echigonensis]
MADAAAAKPSRRGLSVAVRVTETPIFTVAGPRPIVGHNAARGWLRHPEVITIPAPGMARVVQTTVTEL